MDTNLLKTKFERIGARATVRPLVLNRWQQSNGPVVIDVGQDRRGEFFDIQAEDDADVEVLDVQRKGRHLLLMVRQPAERPGLPDTRDKFLCGHDERHWFVAGIPEAAPVSSVVTAKEALKPDLVRNLESGKKGKRNKRNRRKTEVFIRQGEWFFIPCRVRSSMKRWSYTTSRSAEDEAASRTFAVVSIGMAAPQFTSADSTRMDSLPSSTRNC